MPSQYKNNDFNQDYNSQFSVNILHANIVSYSFPLSLVLLVLKAGFPYFCPDNANAGKLMHLGYLSAIAHMKYR